MLTSNTDSLLSSNTWNVLMFYKDEEGGEYLELMRMTPEDDTTIRELEPCATDRTRCHVLLVSRDRNGIATVDAPYVTHFFDPVVYAKQLLSNGFTGCLIKDTHEHSKTVLDICHTIILKTLGLDNANTAVL